MADILIEDIRSKLKHKIQENETKTLKLMEKSVKDLRKMDNKDKQKEYIRCCKDYILSKVNDPTDTQYFLKLVESGEGKEKGGDNTFNYLDFKLEGSEYRCYFAPLRDTDEIPHECVKKKKITLPRSS